jgi:hypothetical protein
MAGVREEDIRNDAIAFAAPPLAESQQIAQLQVPGAAVNGPQVICAEL